MCNCVIFLKLRGSICQYFSKFCNIGKLTGWSTARSQHENSLFNEESDSWVAGITQTARQNILFQYQTQPLGLSEGKWCDHAVWSPLRPLPPPQCRKGQERNLAIAIVNLTFHPSIFFFFLHFVHDLIKIYFAWKRKLV